MVKTDMNGWMLKKIASYMKVKEGCDIEKLEWTKDGAKAIIQDAFGFRYEVNIQTISRIANAPPITDYNGVYNEKR